MCKVQKPVDCPHMYPGALPCTSSALPPLWHSAPSLFRIRVRRLRAVYTVYAVSGPHHPWLDIPRQSRNIPRTAPGSVSCWHRFRHHTPLHRASRPYSCPQPRFWWGTRPAPSWSCCRYPFHGSITLCSPAPPHQYHVPLLSLSSLILQAGYIEENASSPAPDTMDGAIKSQYTLYEGISKTSFSYTPSIMVQIDRNVYR